MTVVTLFNIAMELWGVLICIVCAGGVYVGAIRRTRRTYTKVSMQLLCALMLLADVSAWYHNGGRDKLDFYMTRSSPTISGKPSAATTCLKTSARTSGGPE